MNQYIERIKFLFFGICICCFVTGCNATAYFITGNELYTDSSKSEEDNHPISVFKLTTQEALNIASEISESMFVNSRILQTPDNSSVIVSYFDTWKSGAARISPTPVQNLDDEDDYGVIYKITPYPNKDIADKFFKELQALGDEREFRTATYNKYKILRDKGVPDVVPASVPITYPGFKKYLDDKVERREFEGIWSMSDEKYTLGILYANDDPQYKYHAFIINSKTSNWKPGEIKIKFNHLRERKLAVSNYLLGSKGTVGLTWEVYPELLVAAGDNTSSGIALIKNYPTEEVEVSIAKTGNAWAVTQNGILVTNAHLIGLAKKIYVKGVGGQKYLARVLIVDKRTDIALIKIIDEKIMMKPIPIKKDLIATNGTKINIIAYQNTPAEQTPKILNGIVTGQSGLNDDVTRFQFSSNAQLANSGGPILDSNGNIVGIFVKNIQDSSATILNTDYYAIKSSYVISLLEQIGINIPDSATFGEMPFKDYDYKDSVLHIWAE